ncbi:hypothetical protein INT45_013990 [Circinella minor]|uniref:Tc1-like transposase DDE domain-containing protein n=1 Tax=Circinella minor TaxID=1195481 RepID=A0A8H7VB97_9FUNG|nr:hypothetical protein INT45_013990 [Circinella minor]
MDNASIHHSSIVKGTVENRGFHILYLPPYSPVLNLIEEFWSKLKACVKREILPTSNPFKPRTIQPTYLVTARDFQGWIRHAESYFPRCILEEPIQSFVWNLFFSMGCQPPNKDNGWHTNDIETPNHKMLGATPKISCHQV